MYVYIYRLLYMIVILFSYTTIQLKYIHKQQHQLLLLLQVHQQIAATSTRTTRKKSSSTKHRFMYQKCNKYENY